MTESGYTDRATGKLVPIVADGQKINAFVPNTLPTTISLPTSVSKLVEEAGLSLGRLAGAGEILNPWVQLFLMREAIASNAIEGTITTARELYLFGTGQDEAGDRNAQSQRQEVLNYVKAMQQGINLIKTRPVALNLIRELHAVLMERVRGQNKSPGEIRTRQNAISKKGFGDARYVPPPPTEVMPLLTDLENFVNGASDIPYLARAAMIHYQFESVHPFLDGNGRMGRLLIPLILCSWRILPDGMPRLYLSSYLEANDNEYRNRMLAVSQNGEWDEWIAFFLKAIIAESQRTFEKATELRKLHDKYVQMVQHESGNLQVVVRQMFQWPVLQLKDIARATKVTRQHAAHYAKKLVELGILGMDESGYRKHFFADEILHVFFEEEKEITARQH